MLVPGYARGPHADGSPIADDLLVQLYRKLLTAVGLLVPDEYFDYGTQPYRLGSVLDKLYDESALKLGG